MKYSVTRFTEYFAARMGYEEARNPVRVNKWGKLRQYDIEWKNELKTEKCLKEKCKLSFVELTFSVYIYVGGKSSQFCIITKSGEAESMS